MWGKEREDWHLLVMGKRERDAKMLREEERLLDNGQRSLQGFRGVFLERELL